MSGDTRLSASDPDIRATGESVLYINYYSGDAGEVQIGGSNTCNLDVVGTIYKDGGGFKIDHPLDPENMYLYHSFVESPDMKNIYDGTVTLDGNGEAWIQLPEWFEAVNKDFRYQLTCIGGYAPVYIAEKISNNRFQIAGGNAAMEVSWQVTGIRHDPYARMYPIPVEKEKPDDERGTRKHPEVYGLPESRGMQKIEADSDE